MQAMKDKISETEEVAVTVSAKAIGATVALVALGVIAGGVLPAVTTPCAHEDSSNCYWLGGPNDSGRGFLDIASNTYYLP